MDEGYVDVMTVGLSDALKKANLKASDFSRIALNSPNQRQMRTVTQKLGFDEKKQVQDIFHPSVGDTGSAMSLMSLVAALEQAGKGEKILLATYGNGCDTFIIETTDKIAGLKDKRGIAKHLAAKNMITNYSRYLNGVTLSPYSAAARPPLESASRHPRRNGVK